MLIASNQNQSQYSLDFKRIANLIKLKHTEYNSEYLALLRNWRKKPQLTVKGQVNNLTQNDPVRVSLLLKLKVTFIFMASKGNTVSRTCSGAAWRWRNMRESETAMMEGTPWSLGPVVMLILPRDLQVVSIKLDSNLWGVRAVGWGGPPSKARAHWLS